MRKFKRKTEDGKIVEQFLQLGCLKQGQGGLTAAIVGGRR
jgi:hypothetical protein